MRESLKMGTIIFCNKCNIKTEHRHLSDCCWGLPSTHTSDSERYECTICGHAIYKQDGKQMGLRYFFD
jgi:hypothetical protein